VGVVVGVKVAAGPGVSVAVPISVGVSVGAGMIFNWGWQAPKMKMNPTNNTTFFIIRFVPAGSLGFPLATRNPKEPSCLFL